MSIPLLNGSGGTILDQNQQDCVDLLREALAEAERGSVSTIGIILCLKGGFSAVMAGSRAGDLNLGCDDLKARILSAITSGPAAQRAASKIARIRS